MVFQPGHNLSPGRVSLLNDTLRAAVVNKSWEIVQAALEGKRTKKLTEEQELVLALEIVKRNVPQEVNLGTDYGTKEKIDYRIRELEETIRKVNEFRARIETAEVKAIGDGTAGTVTSVSEKQF